MKRKSAQSVIVFIYVEKRTPRQPRGFGPCAARDNAMLNTRDDGLPAKGTSPKRDALTSLCAGG
ncbi:MAG: hypothetical protein KC418_01070 [Anaerolineales bacterium]|nr:hypothetical protein [Anaerolineales bacterium]MCB8953117.1 hypothetical protein [Ardenticatenales bacterium]